jgi:hypothetical protein
MSERQSQKDEAIGQAAKLVRILRPRWDVFAIASAITELVDDGREFAGAVAAAIRAARDPDVRTPYASVFESHWDVEDSEASSYAGAIAAAKETIRERSTRVRACSRCDDHGYLDGQLCRHLSEEQEAERVARVQERVGLLRAEVRPMRAIAPISKGELVGEWNVTEDARTAAMQALDAHVAEHPELAAAEDAQP